MLTRGHETEFFNRKQGVRFPSRRRDGRLGRVSVTAQPTALSIEGHTAVAVSDMVAA